MDLPSKIRRVTFLNSIFAYVTIGIFADIVVKGRAILLPIIAGSVYAQSALRVAINFFEIKNGLLAKDFRKASTSPVFEVKQDHIRETRFAERVGEVLDELRKDDEGRKLVETAAAKAVGFIEVDSATSKDKDEVADAFGLYASRQRIIKIEKDRNAGDELTISTIHELTHSIQPTLVTQLSYESMREMIAFREGDAFSMPVYLGWKLKEAGHPRLWEQMVSAPHNYVGFTDTEKFEMAVKSSTTLDEARQKFIQDWFWGINNFNYLANAKEIQNVLGFGELPRTYRHSIDFRRFPGWAFEMPGKLLLAVFAKVPRAAIFVICNINSKKHVRIAEDFWGRPYLHGNNFDIPEMAKKEIPADIAAERRIKEDLIKNPDAIEEKLRKYTESTLHLQIILQQVTSGVQIPYNIEGAFQMASEELKTHISQKPETIEDLWSMVDAMPSPHATVLKYMLKPVLGRVAY